MAASAILIGSLEIAFNLVGSISSNAIGIILPSLFYIKLVQKRDVSGKERCLFVKLCFVVAILLTIVCLTSEFIKIIFNNE